MHERPRHPGFASNGSRAPGRTRRLLRTLFAACALLGAAAIALAAPSLRAPREPESIRRALALGPHAGDCERCHSMHAADQPMAYPNALVGPNDNSLCLRCHDTPWAGGSLADDATYRGTGHGSSPLMIWPGPDPAPRVEFDAATKCVNCHDPHGLTDAQGPIPLLALKREEGLCLTCHDGSPATENIAIEFSQPYRHPTGEYSGRHSGPGESQPADFGASPLNQRHAECPDCHNPHVSRPAGSFVPDGAEASKLTLGVSRILALNGAPGTRPLYTFVPASDTLTTPNEEYQLCFKCHSSWTTQPAGQTDMGVELNPANPSYHPVEDVGRNFGISALAFTAGWSPASRTRCGSCHGSDLAGTAGPHGSSNAHLLRQPSPTTSDSRSVSSGELCFSCHSYDVYGDPSSSDATRAASRFNKPSAGKGHAEHVGEEGIPCYACHVTHGSTSMPFLLVVGRSPGIVSYTRTTDGGTCAPSCHGSESYTVNYAR